jgi:hypothetical protein
MVPRAPLLRCGDEGEIEPKSQKGTSSLFVAETGLAVSPPAAAVAFVLAALGLWLAAV